jgi:glycosyltransferase involved in cell wall biosynthesis
MRADECPEFQVEEFPPARRLLRIAFVTETFPPEVNGVSLTVARVVEGLRQRDHDLQLIRPRQHRTELGHTAARFEEVLLRGLPVPRYPQLKMGVPSVAALSALWMRRRPDLVHIATEGPLGWSALRAALKLRLPVTSDFRTNFHAYSRHYGVGWLQRPIVAYLRKFHNRTARTMVPTEALRTELAAAGFERLEVVARGVDTHLFDPARRSEALRQRWGVGARTLVLLHVGRLAPEKNLELLVAAFESVRGTGIDARLVLVGDGPMRAEMEARLPDAVLCGTRSGEDLAAHYASADLFVFPSLTETFGNVTPEAMASGLPVLAFDYAAARQLIRAGDNGATVPVGDPRSFVLRAAGLAADRAGLRRMGERARESAGALDWNRVVAQIETIFSASIHAQPAPSLAGAWRPA